MLKPVFKTSLLITLLLTTGFYVWLKPHTAAHSSIDTERKALLLAGDHCAEIADKSVANVTPIIEFQRLELASRRATTLNNCMADNGYFRNPAWLQFAEPLAKTKALQDNISISEALTHISRADMQVFKLVEGKPSYWLKKA